MQRFCGIRLRGAVCPTVSPVEYAASKTEVLEDDAWDFYS